VLQQTQGTGMISSINNVFEKATHCTVSMANQCNKVCDVGIPLFLVEAHLYNG